jgi:hypothetical protein
MAGNELNSGWMGIIRLRDGSSELAGYGMRMAGWMQKEFRYG